MRRTDLIAGCVILDRVLVVFAVCRGMLGAMQTRSWIVVAVAAAGCETNSGSAGVGVAVEDSAAASSASAVVSQKREKASDVDVKSLQDQFKCNGKVNKEGCDALDGFVKGTAWDLTSIHAQEARYYGKEYSFSGGKVEEKWVFMVVRKTALNEVAEGNLPIRVVIRELDKNLVAENSYADKLWSLLKRDDAITKRNATANYVLAYTPVTWESAVPTTGASTLLLMSDEAYVRQGSNRSLYIVQRRVARPGEAGSSSSLYRLIPLSW